MVRCQVETPIFHLEEAMAMMMIDSAAKDKTSQHSRLQHKRKRRRSRKMYSSQLNSKMTNQLPASKPSPLLNIAVSHQVADPTSLSAEND